MTGVPASPSGCEAPPSAADASSQGRIPNAKWVRGPFKTKVGGTDGPAWLTVNGHSDGLFGLDRRRYLDDECNFKFGYCVTHLPTGYAVRYVRATLPEAKRFVGALRVTSWDFSDPSKAKADPRRVVAVEAACSVCATSGGIDFDPPASAIEAAAAGETRSGSTEGESAAPKGDAQPTPRKGTRP